MTRKLKYINQGPGGYVVYKDGRGDIQFFFAYGGGNCVTIIYVPAMQEWPHKTNRSIEERQTILEFVAEQSIKDQAPGGYYKLTDSCIEIFK